MVLLSASQGRRISVGGQLLRRASRQPCEREEQLWHSALRAEYRAPWPTAARSSQSHLRYSPEDPLASPVRQRAHGTASGAAVDARFRRADTVAVLPARRTPRR